MAVEGISYDSRKVEQKDLFCCIPGERFDGHEFIPQALDKGASALLVERSDQVPEDIPHLIVGSVRKALPRVAATYYDNPSSELLVIGVTGTNGKTSTTFLVRHLLQKAGAQCGLIGTVWDIVGGDRRQVQRTTPESVDLQKTLREMVAAQDEACVMEVSSSALALNMVDGTEFDAAVFTNLTQDHLDVHGNLENYKRAKMQLFRFLGDIHGWDRAGYKAGRAHAVINADDGSAGEFAGATPDGVGRLFYGLEASSADLKAEKVAMDLRGTQFEMRLGEASVFVSLPLAGRFNVYNALAASAVGLGQGMELEDIAAALESAEPVPGRFQLIEGEDDHGFAVVVDYAHTPDSLEQVLLTAREAATNRVLVVFGCGGDRDRDKRPLMGAVAAREADFAVLTADNPRSENPAEIIDAMEEGFRRDGADNYERCVDRREAVFRAVELARPGDMVVLAGKGHETTQVFASETIHFDDREVAKEALKHRAAHS